MATSSVAPVPSGSTAAPLIRIDPDFSSFTESADVEPPQIHPPSSVHQDSNRQPLLVLITPSATISNQIAQIVRGSGWSVPVPPTYVGPVVRWKFIYIPHGPNMMPFGRNHGYSATGRYPPRSDRLEQCYTFGDKVGYRDKNMMPGHADLCFGLPGVYTVNCWTEFNGCRSAVTQHRFDIRAAPQPTMMPPN